jgi:uncharacterized protein (DUF885 family)
MRKNFGFGMLILALTPASAARAQDVVAGSGPFIVEALDGCRSDLSRLNQMFGWQVRWPGEWAAMARMDDGQIRAAIGRWEAAPAALADDLAALRRADFRRAPEVVSMRVLAQVRALLTSLRVAPPRLRESAPADLRADWNRLFVDRIVPAIARHEAFLGTEYRPSVSAGLGDAQCFRRSAAYFTSLDLGPEEIERTGRRLLGETEAELARLHGISPARIPALLASLRTRQEPGFTEDRLVEISRAAITRAEAAVPRLFSRPIQMPVAVEPMPRTMEASFPAGFYRAPDEDGGDGNAAYVINRSRPADRRLMAEVIAFHEALPGHHIGLGLGYPEGVFNSGFVEGWAIYAEYLADEAGLYSSNLDRTGMITKHLWAASRLVVEPGLHVHGWSRQQAIDFMLHHTALSQEEIALEVDRYIALPGQSLAYMLGYDRIAAARRYAERRMGRRFDLRQFHDVVWSAGPRPLDQMDADVRRWAERVPTSD